MENTIELLKKEHIDWLANKFDEAFDFQEIISNKFIGTAIEAVDKKGASITLGFGNKRASIYIPDEYKDEIHLALDDIMDEDDNYSIAISNGIEILDQLKDKLTVSPFIKAIINSLLEMVKAAILIYLENKEKE